MANGWEATRCRTSTRRIRTKWSANMPAPARRTRKRQSRRRKPLSRNGRAQARWSATPYCASDETCAQGRACKLLSREGQDGGRRRRNRALRIFDFFAREALRLARPFVLAPGVGVEVTREAVGGRHHYAAEFPDAIRPGRSRRRSATATRSSSSRPIWCPAAPGPSSTYSSAPACRTAS